MKLEGREKQKYENYQQNIQLLSQIQSIDENVEFIKKCSKPEYHKKMCENVYETFRKHINFEEEAKQVKCFLGKLQ